MRIVSLVPSLTDTVCALGLKDNLVGVTGFCVKPPGLHKIAVNVGGTKDPDLKLITDLQPTHILVNVEENQPDHIVFCHRIAPTFECFPRSVSQGIAMIKDLATFLGKTSKGEALVSTANQLLDKINKVPQILVENVAYLVWQQPYMAAGTDTYISEMMALMGFHNALDASKDRYPIVSIDGLADLNLHRLLLSSEPYPFRRRDCAKILNNWPPGKSLPKVYKIDGQMMSWYGSTQVEALEQILAFRVGANQKLIRPL